MLKKKKKFALPKKLFDSARIKEENKLKVKYGLKNKKEIWKTEAKIKYFRDRAKKLITAEQEEQQKFFANLNKIGLKVESVSDVLALEKEDLLKRRLPSLLVEKKFATKPKQARQMVVHKRILINGKVVSIPSYIVKVVEENKITIKKKIKKPKPVKIEEPKEETKNENRDQLASAEEKSAESVSTESQSDNTEEVKEKENA